MNRAVIGAALALAFSPAWATPCEEVAAAIAAKIEAKGVKNYTLEILPAAAEVPAGKKVVAVCDNGRNKLVYGRR
ncbi:MAG TPA: DUF1161 domain-containing protein [Solimonas sp.]|nr:DUF1161 domain-containing protein [Solimonas sp.]